MTNLFHLIRLDGFADISESPDPVLREVGSRESPPPSLRLARCLVPGRRLPFEPAFPELSGGLTSGPLEPEDIFELSRDLDGVLNNAKNAVRELEVMQTAPDAAIAEMATELAEGTRHLTEAFAALGRRRSADALWPRTVRRRARSG